MAPLAPARFSTTTVWPNSLPNCSLMVRAMKSTGPPGGKATSSRVTLVCAQAAVPRLNQANRAKVVHRLKRVLMIIMVSEGLCQRGWGQGQSQRTDMPPSTTISVPVMKRASSLAKNKTARAVSRPSPMKGRGMRAWRACNKDCTSPPAR